MCVRRSNRPTGKRQSATAATWTLSYLFEPVWAFDPKNRLQSQHASSAPSKPPAKPPPKE